MVQLSPLSVRHRLFFFFLHWTPRGKEVPVSSASPWILEGMCSWSGFILWAGGGEAGQSPNYTNWDNQMTSLIHPWDAAAKGVVWTYKHTEVCCSFQSFLQTHNTFSQIKLQTSDVRFANESSVWAGSFEWFS